MKKSKSKEKNLDDEIKEIEEEIKLKKCLLEELKKEKVFKTWNFEIGKKIKRKTTGKIMIFSGIKYNELNKLYYPVGKELKLNGTPFYENSLIFGTRSEWEVLKEK